MAGNGTNEPDRDVEAAAVRVLDALVIALDAFTRGFQTATAAAEMFRAELEEERKRRKS